MNPTDQQFQALLQAHNYTPAATKTAPTSGWYDKLQSSPADEPKSYAEQVTDQAKGGVKQGSDALTRIVGGESSGKAAEDALNVESGVATTALSPAAPVFNKINEGVQKVEGAISDNPTVQRFAMKLPDFDYQRAAQDFSNVSNVTGSIAGLKAPTKVADITDAVKENMKSPPEDPGAMKAQAAADAKALSTAQSKKVADQWQKPSTVNTAAFNKTRAALEQAPGSPQFLGEQGLNPAAHIEDGRYQTEDSAQMLRDTAAKMSKEGLRPSLQMADYTTQKTPVATIVKSAIDRASGDKSLTATEYESIVSKLKNEQAALENKYPDGMSLTDMHDEKITYAGKAGYSPLKSAADNLGATSNRHLSSILGNMVEAKAPKDVSVDDFNKYLSQYYKAADYLDTLNTKKAPVTLGQTIAQGAAKYTGAALGVHLGGGVVSGFAGYSMGKALEHALENLKGRAQSTFVDNIQKTNPEAYTKVQQYLKDQTSGNTGIPRLNPPSTIQLGPAELGTTRDVPQSPNSKSPNTTIPTTNSTNANMEGSIPQDVQNAIENHLTSTEQVIKEMGDAGIAKNGGFPALLEQTKTNIADGLEASRMKAVADHVRNFDLTPFKDWNSFKQTFMEYIKNVQPGLSMKTDTSLGVSPMTVARVIKQDDLPTITKFIEDPSLENLMKLAPILAGRGLEDLDPKHLQQFLQDVVDERKQFTVGEITRAKPPAESEVAIKSTQDSMVDKLMASSDQHDLIPRSEYEKYVLFPQKKINVDDIYGLDHRGLMMDAEKPGRQIDVPILVNQNADGTFQLVDGHHRVTQAMINKEKTIQAFVKP